MNDINIKGSITEIILRHRNGEACGICMVDTEDYELVKNYSWYLTDQGYVKAKFAGKNVSIHRLITGAPHDKVVDHINHNTLDNTKLNLRVCTRSQNQRNMRVRSDNNSGKAGVRYHKKWGWQAYTFSQGKQHHIGWFKTKQDAVNARLEKERADYGEYAYGG